MFGMKDIEGAVWFEELFKTKESILGIPYDDIRESEEHSRWKDASLSAIFIPFRLDHGDSDSLPFIYK